ncbi:MAG TPA: thioredoxin domain-containing protein [Candidatus Didemnitutus sp.]|nr:thioredoxin domain-containing protein [Candidatus Didemnitutus sp.]
MPNLLAAERSPYLRQHADNPVDWLPWSDESLARARAEGKPVFLSIGYAACHWCHVMAHESFENPEVAALLNRSFISIKVDREERPDIDRIYMNYVQQTTGHGGWPMSVWLTPDGLPFYGGTYFPPSDRGGRPGFATLLGAIARHWTEQRDQIEKGAADVAATLREAAAAAPTREGSLADAAGDALEGAFRYFHENFDGEQGGFGGAPKFPRASVISFLFRVAAMQGPDSGVGAEAIRLATHTLRRMAEGGIHDHVGGGFHRYSVDERWHVPHFEKMLYDQAQIASNYLEAYQITGREVFAWVTRDILDYVLRDLCGPEGEFLSSEDADSRPDADAHEHREGAFYVWTRKEIESVLGEDAPLFCAHFGVRENGNAGADPTGELQGQNVLMQQCSLSDTARRAGIDLEAANEKLVASLARLRAARERRPRPGRDGKVVAAWNGLMISALARAARLLDEPKYLVAAGRAAEFLARHLSDESGDNLYRTWLGTRSPVPAFAEDYAAVIQGLLDLYEAGFDVRWLQCADRLQAAMDRMFWDERNGGYFSTRSDDATVIMRLKEDTDAAEASAISLAVANLVRLDWMIGAGPDGSTTMTRTERARRAIDSLSRQWTSMPFALPQLLCGIEWVLSEPRTIALAGNATTSGFRALAGVAAKSFRLRQVLLHADGSGAQWLGQTRPYLAAMKPVDGKPTAYVCENETCQAPVTTPEELARILM